MGTLQLSRQLRLNLQWVNLVVSADLVLRELAYHCVAWSLSASPLCLFLVSFLSGATVLDPAACLSCAREKFHGASKEGPLRIPICLFARKAAWRALSVGGYYNVPFSLGQ